MTPAKQERVLRMTRAGYKRRYIAKLLDVSYGEVCRVLREAGLTAPAKSPTGRSYAEELQFQTRKFERCPKCGALVQSPCLECQLETDHKIKRLMK